MTACFWAGFRRGLRRNTCADRLKLIIYLMWPAQTAAIFFWRNAKANSKASSHLDEPSRPGSVPAINILRLARPQLATASLNFGVGRSQSFCVKPTIRARTPATQNFCQLLDLSFGVSVIFRVRQLRRGLIPRKRLLWLREKSYVLGKLSLIRIHISDYSQNLVYISNGYAY